MMHNCMKFSFLVLTIVHSGGILDLKDSDFSVSKENDCHCTFKLLSAVACLFLSSFFVLVNLLRKPFFRFDLTSMHVATYIL